MQKGIGTIQIFVIFALLVLVGSIAYYFAGVVPVIFILLGFIITVFLPRFLKSTKNSLQQNNETERYKKIGELIGIISVIITFVLLAILILRILQII
ncbi:MAG: hypothetical protein G01um101429_377 [Parcubacteria group bacterium Gr01-1014_29]|nr:MAG: hypothetical protein G01um101429_377 [Parcubacteria group bacterium Gr01-1014_29]